MLEEQRELVKHVHEYVCILLISLPSEKRPFDGPLFECGAYKKGVSYVELMSQTGRINHPTCTKR